MTTVELTDAGPDWAALLERVEGGERIALTRAGKPVALFEPPPPTPPPYTADEWRTAFREMLADRDRRARELGPGPSIREMIEEGRRY